MAGMAFVVISDAVGEDDEEAEGGVSVLSGLIGYVIKNEKG